MKSKPAALKKEMPRIFYETKEVAQNKIRAVHFTMRKTGPPACHVNLPSCYLGKRVRVIIVKEKKK